MFSALINNLPDLQEFQVEVRCTSSLSDLHHIPGDEILQNLHSVNLAVQYT